MVKYGKFCINNDKASDLPSPKRTRTGRDRQIQLQVKGSFFRIRLGITRPLDSHHSHGFGKSKIRSHMWPMSSQNVAEFSMNSQVAKMFYTFQLGEVVNYRIINSQVA